MDTRRNVGKGLMGLGFAAVLLMGFLLSNHIYAMFNPKHNDLEQLLQLGQEAVDTPLHAVVKWQGTWGKQGEEPSLAAQRLVRALDLPKARQLIENEHTTYRSLGEKDGVNVRFNWQVISPGQSYIIVQLDTTDHQALASLPDLKDKFGEKIKEFGIEAAWNASVQGNVKEKKSSAAVMQQVEDSIGQHLQLNKAEFYEDTTTLSNTYEVPSLTVGVRSGEKELNMQLAVHEDGDSGYQRVTIGLPIITIEY